MKVSVKWLGDFVDLDGITVENLAERLTSAGLEVGEIDVKNDPHIRVGRIAEIEDHPKADRLVMCKVDVGDGQIRNIACGAKNMKAGDVVPVALPGAKPPGIDFEIIERKVVGVVSEGMLCAEEELGLADASDGLWILPEDLPIGEPIFEALELDDVAIGIDLTPNRPDCLSHRGVGREIAALLDVEFNDVDAVTVAGSGGPISDVASLDNQDVQGCPRYTMAVIENVKVGPSPAWLSSRLAAIGVRSINNIVDVTNYMIHHVGQPLHAFDLDKLEGGITVRRARDIEKMVGIDHKTHEVDGRDLVIADDNGPVAIAGVMGGESTEVTEETTRILIECAYFDPTTVRKTSKRLGLHTESSHRFERGIDPNAVGANLELAVALMVEAQAHLGADEPIVREGRIESYPSPIAPAVVDFDPALVKRILGIEIGNDEVTGYLTRLGLGVDVSDASLKVTIPTYRPDLERPIDLVEEVARLHGFNNIEPKFAYVSLDRHHTERPEPGHPPTIVPSKVRREVSRMRSMLLGFGLFEAVNYSFMSQAELEQLVLAEDDPRRHAPKIANPLTQEHAFLRTTLAPGMLRTLATNVAQRERDMAVFEIGRVYFKEAERAQLTMLATGAMANHFADGRKAWDYFDVKGLVESLLMPFELGDLTWRVPTETETYLHPGVQAELISNGERIALVGQFHPAVVHDLELEHGVFYAEVELDRILGREPKASRLQPIPRFPAMTRDFAFLYDRARPFSELESAVGELAAADAEFGELLESVSLFDVYEGEQIPAEKRSLALKLVYRSSERTLTDDEVAKADSRLVAWLNEKVGADLR